ncbi:hypothetical protein PsYK624_011660 [Phanerochaete sordida]|uniref:DUF6533 domain-containing protein n=1 Tax=Phanerochaete sordida TaxID=48140 RepID=A0A9P3L829_9APHY|nr:hypothetical protein PsYK624_011660 [Phanerochaete sordida]
MSDDSFDDLAAAVAQITIADSIALAMSALVFFDYLITFRQEVCTVWQRRPSVVSLLIVSTRWCLLFEATTSLYPYGPLLYGDIMDERSPAARRLRPNCS